MDDGLPVTAQDIEALFRARMQSTPLSFALYIAFLAGLPPMDQESLRSRPGPGGEPFRL
ncbi:MAG: hypothetical protein ACREAA_10370 [Candidatus Polarisedimenticolia bacterium]